MMQAASEAGSNEKDRGKDLRVSWLSFRDFRSYERFELSDIGDLTVLVGPNATGKTNAIEGISLLTALSSFKNSTGAQLVRWGCGEARLRAGLDSASRSLEVDLSIREGRKFWRLNGKPKSAASFRGLLPAVSFTPDDLDLVKGSMGGKRAMLDDLGAQLAPNYGFIRRDYEKLLHHKNKLLKEDAVSRFDPGVLESVNETLVFVGSQLFCYRAALFSRLIGEVARFYREITGGYEEVTGVYTPSWEAWNQKRSPYGVEGLSDLNEGFLPRSPLPSGFKASTPSRDEAADRLRRALGAAAADERRRGRALIGPHADMIEFFIDGRSAREFGSQGQQRSIVLSIKLAEVALIRSMLDQRPVLLLDDVMSELDAARRTALVRFISGDIQTFITTANLEYFTPELLAQARVVSIGGKADRERASVLVSSACKSAQRKESSETEVSYG